MVCLCLFTEERIKPQKETGEREREKWRAKGRGRVDKKDDR